MQGKPLTARASLMQSVLVRAFLTWLAYAGVGTISLVLTKPTDVIVPMYLPAGIGLACVIGWGWWMVLPVGLGAATVMLAASSLPMGPWQASPVLLPICLATMTGAALQAWVGARWSGVTPQRQLRLESPREIARFVLLSGAVACLINATTVTCMMVALGQLPANAMLATASSWWGGDALGVLIGTPMMLTLVGQPADLWRSRRRVVGIPLVTTTLLLGWTIHQVQRWESDREETVFVRDAQSMASSVKVRLNGYLYALEAVHGASIASDELTRREFRLLTEYWLESLGGIQAMGWSERVPAAQIPTFEQRQRIEGLTDYMVSDGRDRHPPQGDEVVAIRYIEPLTLNQSALGHNILSSPIPRATYEQARLLDTPVASPGFKLIQEVGNQTGVVLYKALYWGQPATAEEHRLSTRGVIFLTLRMDDMIQVTTAGRAPYLHACMLDVESQQVLGGDPGCPAQAGAAPPLHRTNIPLIFANRSWQLVIWTDSHPPLVKSLASSWLFAVGGVSLAAALGALLLVITGRAKRVEEAMAHARQQQAAAESANQAKSEFLSRMSHELRTPLNAVLGFAQVMELDRQNPLGQPQQHRLQQIQQAGWHLLEMIDDVLDLSRIDTGTIKLQTEVVSPQDAVAAASQMVTELAQKHLVRLLPTDAGPVGWGIVADPTRLRQILINLLGNAIKYNRPNGTVQIAIKLRQPKGASPMLDLVVSDTGLGMSEAQQSQLFQPFNRLGRERLSADGVGIGLVISQHLAHMMKGDLSCESSEGEGSRFTLSLPAAELSALPPVTAPIPQVVAASSPSASSLSQPPRHVIYVEDNQTNSELIRNALASRPWLKLTVAPTSEAGLNAVLDRSRGPLPDLVLLDMHLPDASGLEVLKRLKTNPTTARIPVIVISADAMPERIDAALAAGAYCYLTKPVQLPALLVHVDDLLKDKNSPAMN